MVVKLTGSINGTEITLERESGDRWTAIIPSIPSGVYIVDLTAWDEAGNFAYVTKYIITIDLTAMCMRVRIEEYDALHDSGKDYLCRTGADDFTVQVQDEICVREIDPEYTIRVKVGEPCDCF